MILKEERARMRFQYCSDLHLEKLRHFPRIIPRAPILLLAGDIGHPNTSIYSKFFQQCSHDFEYILFVDGNHEYDRPFNPFLRANSLPKNVIHLQNDYFDLFGGSVRCFGTTLWTPTVNQLEHKKSLQFLHKQLDNNTDSIQRKIVMTHHLPSFKLIVPKYQRYRNLNRFANDLDYLMLNHTTAPDFWISGHSHCVLDKTIGYTRCLINANPSRNAGRNAGRNADRNSDRVMEMNMIDVIKTH